MDGIVTTSIGNLRDQCKGFTLQDDAVLEYTLANDDIINIDLYDISGRLALSILKTELRNKGSHKEILGLDASLPESSYILTLVLVEEFPALVL
jgi:hypothetical protein